MEIKLDNEMLKGLVSEAILKSLDNQKREALIQGALQHLITPQSTGYGRSESPLQAAFTGALTAIARQVATDLMQGNEGIMAQIKTLVDESMVKVMTDRREAVVNNIASAIEKGFTKDY